VNQLNPDAKEQPTCTRTESEFDSFDVNNFVLFL